MKTSRKTEAGVHCKNPDQNTLALSGALTFATAAHALADAGRALAHGAQTRLDLAEVTGADSAGLACVLALIADASRAGRRLIVVNLPEGLRALAQVCGVEPLLGAV
ncbi:MAG: STAS domain-containing protein [Rhodanobacteraceae bacterium]